MRDFDKKSFSAIAWFGLQAPAHVKKSEWEFEIFFLKSFIQKETFKIICDIFIMLKWSQRTLWDTYHVKPDHFNDGEKHFKCEDCSACYKSKLDFDQIPNCKYFAFSLWNNMISYSDLNNRAQ